MILNAVDGKFYLWSSINLRKRKNSHWAQLIHNKHHCAHLQNSFNFHGSDKFEFFCVEYCKIDGLLSREQTWLDRYWNMDRLFNSFREAYAVHGENHPLYGKPRPEAVKEKIRQKRKFQVVKHSVETKQKIGKKSLGRKASAETCKKISALKKGWNKGKPAWNKGKPSQTAVFIPEPEFELIVSDYEKGNSLLALSNKYPYSWGVLKSNFKNRGILNRSISEQKVLNNKNSPPISNYPVCLATGNCGGKKEGRFCRTHWSQYYRGIIDKDGNKLRGVRENHE